MKKIVENFALAETIASGLTKFPAFKKSDVLLTPSIFFVQIVSAGSFIDAKIDFLVFSSYFELHSLVLFNPPYFSRKNFFISMVLNQLQVFYKSKIQQKTIDLEL